MRRSWVIRRGPHKHERGQDAAEFAVLLPLLLLVIVGILDLGRFLYAAIVITNAAREGARYASMYPADGVGVEAAAIAEAAGSGIDLSDPNRADILISCPDAGGCGRGWPIRVEITYQFELILGALGIGPDLPVRSYADFMVP